MSERVTLLADEEGSVIRSRSSRLGSMLVINGQMPLRPEDPAHQVVHLLDGSYVINGDAQLYGPAGEEQR